MDEFSGNGDEGEEEEKKEEIEPQRVLCFELQMKHRVELK